MELTGLVSGSVPPFGTPVLDLPLYVDRSILENEKIAFNAGSLTDSMIMSMKDYVRIAAFEVFDFSSPA
jgi:prolyl-tRNA editing enzyme YbaK/EbsC (Cys-tRNA(Pro) deacylase)